MNLLSKENVEDVNLTCDQLQYVIDKMFPNIIGGYHWLGEGQCDNNFKQVAPSRIIAWNCSHTKPSATLIMEAWEVLKSNFETVSTEDSVPEEPTQLSIEDLKNL